MFGKVITIAAWALAISALMLQLYFRQRIRTRTKRYYYVGDRLWLRCFLGYLALAYSLLCLTIPEAVNWSMCDTVAVKMAGAILIIIAFCLRIWSQLTLGLNWSTSVSIRKDHQLIQKGPYRWIRHPMYTGYFLIAAGLVLATDINPAILLLWSLFLHFLTKRAWIEETMLQEHFGREHDLYRQNTGMFFPGRHSSV